MFAAISTGFRGLLLLTGYAVVAFMIYLVVTGLAFPLIYGGVEVTAQVLDPDHARRRDFARFLGSAVKASMIFQPCFLAVERKERTVAKSLAPSSERNPPEIF